MIRYTVMTDSSSPRRHLTLKDAAEELLTYDSHEYEIRPEDDGTGYRLWITPFSRASTFGGQAMIKSRFFSLSGDLESAEREIFDAVVLPVWHGAWALTDDSFDEIM